MSLMDNAKEDFHKIFLDDDEFADPIQYEISGGATKNIKSVILSDSSTQEFRDDGEYYIKTVELAISTDATEGIDAPTQKDFVVIDSLRWGIVTINDDHMGVAILTVQRTERITKGRITT